MGFNWYFIIIKSITSYHKFEITKTAINQINFHQGCSKLKTRDSVLELNIVLRREKGQWSSSRQVLS